MNSHYASTIIFSNSQLKAEHKMRQLVEASGEVINRQTNFCIETDKGAYLAVRWNPGIRGYRFHDAYVDESISDQEVLECIVPCLRIKESEEIYYNWKDHVHYY